jgi:hypothetical protein
LDKIYLRAHPELSTLIELFCSDVSKERPSNLEQYAKTWFSSETELRKKLELAKQQRNNE